MPRTIAKVATSLSTEAASLAQDPLHQIESPMERAMELMGDKYSFQIIDILHRFEKQRFVELEDQISGISPRTLSARLKHLEYYGLILRHQFPTIPPRVEYSLTERGKDLAGVITELLRWTNTWYPFQPV
ncbi:MAG: helix-turn-helix domain-containing protein [Candidatus Melainabacteria bacterium]|nr:helix-turn-helix domain-containing protein [Candidatus Melainabacteria bacterium]